MFYDVMGISYEKLKKQIETTKPYRGSKDAYPLGYREYSDRHFRAREDGTFDIFYCDRTKRDALEKGEIEAGWVGRRHLATLHPNNDLEFVNTTYMGDNLLMTRLSGAHVQHCRGMGGTILKSRGFPHPVFQNMRYNLTTHEVVTPYKVFQGAVNRKATAEMMQRYEEFIKVAPIMISQLDEGGVRQTIDDLDKQFGLKNRVGFFPDVIELVEKKHYVDAGLLYMLDNRFGRSYWWFSHPNTKHVRDVIVKHMNEMFPRSFRLQAVKHHDTLNWVDKTEKGISKNNWGTKVFVNGAEAIRL